MRRTLTQQIDDWFFNSPSWPFSRINLKAEIHDFQQDCIGEDQDFLDSEVEAAIRSFATLNNAEIIE